jgi:predicted dehydrogenase
VRISPERPAKAQAIIIANAARDHGDALENVLPLEAAVLVEKPFTMTATETRRLIAMAAQRRVPLAASHVFLFSRYLPNLAARIPGGERVVQLAFRWSDPRAEFRHGDKKTYDPGLPLHLDVLPHISSLAGALLPGAPQSCRRVVAERGGAHLRLELQVGEVPCVVEMARDGAGRERRIEVTTERRRLALDFTSEPRFIEGDGRTSAADPGWGIEDGPLACMLRAFLSAAKHGTPDPRLSTALALLATELADEATPLYRLAVRKSLTPVSAQPGADADEGLRYALREQLHAGRYIENAAADAEIEEALKKLRGASADEVLDFIASRR